MFISDSSQTYSGRVFSKGLSFCGFKFPRKAKVRYFAKHCIVHQYISCCQILQEYIIIQINFKTISCIYIWQPYHIQFYSCSYRGPVTHCSLYHYKRKPTVNQLTNLFILDSSVSVLNCFPYRGPSLIIGTVCT